MIENLIPISEIEAWENIMLMLSGNLSQVPKIATYAKKVISTGKTANGIRDRIFWKKFYKLLDEESLTQKQREKFLKKLANEKNKDDNAMRIIQIIDRIQSMKKVDYILNLCRNFAIDKIDIETYFRLCNMITETLEEDLLFLKKHINDKAEFLYCNSVQGLVNNGLMSQSVIDTNEGEDMFAFLPIADMLYKYALLDEE